MHVEGSFVSETQLFDDKVAAEALSHYQEIGKSIQGRIKSFKLERFPKVAGGACRAAAGRILPEQVLRQRCP